MFRSIFREIIAQSQTLSNSTHFALSPALSIMFLVRQRVVFTGSLTTMAIAFQPTVTSRPSLALRGPWLCPTTRRIGVYPSSPRLRLSLTLQSTKIPKTGMSTAWVCLALGPLQPTPLIGEQPAATQAMVSILQTTFVVTLRISTLSTFLETVSVRRWNTLTYAGTVVYI